MFAIYDEREGKKFFVKAFKDKFSAEAELTHIKSDFPKYNLIIIEETKRPYRQLSDRNGGDRD